MVDEAWLQRSASAGRFVSTGPFTLPAPFPDAATSSQASSYRPDGAPWSAERLRCGGGTVVMPEHGLLSEGHQREDDGTLSAAEIQLARAAHESGFSPWLTPDRTSGVALPVPSSPGLSSPRPASPTLSLPAISSSASADMERTPVGRLDARPRPSDTTSSARVAVVAFHHHRQQHGGVQVRLGPAVTGRTSRRVRESVRKQHGAAGATFYQWADVVLSDDTHVRVHAGTVWQWKGGREGGV